MRTEKYEDVEETGAGQADLAVLLFRAGADDVSTGTGTDWGENDEDDDDSAKGWIPSRIRRA